MKTSSAILCSLAVLAGMHGPGTVAAQDPAEPTLTTPIPVVFT